MQNFHTDYYFDLSAYLHAPLFRGISFVWEALPKINSYLKALPLGNREVDIPEGAHIIDPHMISIGKGTVIEPGAYIKGPCVIGNNCVIRHGAYIRGDFICGNQCVIGHDTEVKNAIFLDNTHAAHFAYVGDSILGNHVNLGAGTKCANLKFDQSPIILHFEGTSIRTNLRKFGAIIGDHGQVGCNAVTNPGVLLGKNAFVYPCVNVNGVIPSDSIIKNNTHQKVFPKSVKV